MKPENLETATKLCKQLEQLKALHHNLSNDEHLSIHIRDYKNWAYLVLECGLKAEPHEYIEEALLFKKNIIVAIEMKIVTLTNRISEL